MHSKKKKPSKREQERLDYEKWLRSFDKLPKFARQQHAPDNSKLLVYELSIPPGRPLADQKSRVTAGSSTALPANKQYTGNKMLGVGVLHKSNSVPIFTSDDAKDIAHMRR